MKKSSFRTPIILTLILAGLMIFSQTNFSQSPQQARLQTGIVFFEGGKTAEAKAIFDQLVAEGYVNNDLYYYLGSVLIKQNKPEEALNYFNKILQNAPNSPYGYIGKAQYYIKKANYPSAETQLNTAIQKDPN